MRKLSLTSLVLIVLSMVLAACGSSGNNSGSNSGNATPGGFGNPTSQAPGVSATATP